MTDRWQVSVNGAEPEPHFFSPLVEQPLDRRMVGKVMAHLDAQGGQLTEIRLHPDAYRQFLGSFDPLWTAPPTDPDTMTYLGVVIREDHDVDRYVVSAHVA
jgi:hypothetical protein